MAMDWNLKVYEVKYISILYCFSQAFYHMKKTDNSFLWLHLINVM